MGGLNQMCCVHECAWRGYLPPIAHPLPLRGRISPAQELQGLGSRPPRAPGQDLCADYNLTKVPAGWVDTITSN